MAKRDRMNCRFYSADYELESVDVIITAYYARHALKSTDAIFVDHYSYTHSNSAASMHMFTQHRLCMCGSRIVPHRHSDVASSMRSSRPACNAVNSTAADLTSAAGLSSGMCTGAFLLLENLCMIREFQSRHPSSRCWNSMSA